MDHRIVSFGEIMLRLTPPGGQLIGLAHGFDGCYGGSESNVLVCLSSLGHRTEYLTALPDNDLGTAAIRHLAANGVGTGHILRSPDRMGVYFLENGFGSRGTKVIYDRQHSAVSLLDEGAFDYDAVFAGCSLLHICGISFAISPSARRLSFALVAEAKKRGIPVSFDFNYRAKLWTVAEAALVYQQIIPQVDILFCSQRDLQAFLHTDVDRFFAQYGCEYLVVREREVLSGDTHRAHASLYHREKAQVHSGQVTFPVLERIGSGDAFVGGVLHGLLENSADLQGALDCGMACFVLKHTQQGDVFTLGPGAVRDYCNSLAKDVSR